MVTLSPLAEVPGDETIVFPARAFRVANPLVHSNVHLFRDEAFTRWLHEENRSRDEALDPVRLKRYPSGALLMGHHTHWLHTSGTVVLEQVNPIEIHPRDGFDALLAHLPQQKVDGPCLLAARFGASVWGHWVSEILPKIVVAEHVAPGRFRFVVPSLVTTVVGHGRSFARAVLESLAAYGIGPDRLLRVEADVNVRFDELYDVAGVWSHAAMNRDVCQLLRDRIRGVPAAPGEGGGRLALLRRDATTRNIRNSAEIETIAAARGLVATEVERLPFVEQVALFRDSRLVLGALGSGLAGLLHAPDEARVLTVAPAGWYDSYFTNLIQERRALLSDVRGARVWDGVQPIEAAPIDVHPSHVEEGLDRLDDASLDPAADRIAGGETVVAAVGDVMLDLVFAAGGNAVPCLRDGWSYPEPTHVWMIGAVATLVVPRPGRGDLLLEWDGLGIVAEPFLRVRPLGLFVNGVAVADTTFGRGLRWLVAVPASTLGDADAIGIELRCPIAASPLALGIGADDRPLGAAISRLRIRRRPDR